MQGLHIEGRRWFQRTWGNTYHSVRIFADGTYLGGVDKAYGYGDQYIETALEWLENNGHIQPRERVANGSKPGGTYFVREALGGTVSVVDVSRQRDL